MDTGAAAGHPSRSEAARHSSAGRTPTTASLRLFCRHASSYWRGGPRCAWPLTIALASVVLVSLAVTYGINFWNRRFFDALEARNAASVLHEGLVFPLLIGGYLALCVFAMWARMTMQRTWRAWINDRLLDQWLTKGRCYRLECEDGDHKNPEHRINDDLRIATEMPVDFATGFATAALSAVTFVAVLWTTGGALTIAFGGHSIRIEGFMVVAAVLYAAIANAAMLLIARRFIPLTARKNQAEAEYRYALTRIRENAESIALLRGDDAERSAAGRSFAHLLEHWRVLVGQQMRAVIVSQGHAQLCGVVPILLCTPRYLDGTMTLGQIMQLASAFTIVQGALNWLVDNYTRIADWSASARRVGSLLAALDRIERDEHGPRQRIDRIRHACTDDGRLHIRKLSVSLPGGGALASEIDIRVQSGERVLLVGDSGAGKSALVRAIGGAWPWGGGEIVRSAGICVLPQRPYIPAGTLRHAISYPRPAGHFPPAQVAAALEAVGLAQFSRRLDEERSWCTSLSEGERQRIAFARLLLLRPSLVVLDEATSALHVRAQAELMRLLDRELPASTILSIGHRPELEAFHRRKLTLQACPGGARIIADGPIPAASALLRVH